MKYATPPAFAAALKTRLTRQSESTGMNIQRVRQLIAFDRLMARFAAAKVGHVIKGGFVLELRIGRARTTRDVDVSIYGDTANLTQRVQKAAELDLGDFFEFVIQRPAKASKAIITGPGVAYGGQRFRCTCLLGGRKFEVFGLDVAIADPPSKEQEDIPGLDWLTFAGIEPAMHPVLPRPYHIAQKLHAYTYPRPAQQPNSRDQDLPDLALIATIGPLYHRTVREAITSTFTTRATHDMPTFLPEPPRAWSDAYSAKARENDWRWQTLDDAYAAARAFIDPILTDATDATWNPETWTWIPARASIRDLT